VIHGFTWVPARQPGLVQRCLYCGEFEAEELRCDPPRDRYTSRMIFCNACKAIVAAW